MNDALKDSFQNYKIYRPYSAFIHSLRWFMLINILRLCLEGKIFYLLIIELLIIRED